MYADGSIGSVSATVVGQHEPGSTDLLSAGKLTV